MNIEGHFVTNRNVCIEVICHRHGLSGLDEIDYIVDLLRSLLS